MHNQLNLEIALYHVTYSVIESLISQGARGDTSWRHRLRHRGSPLRTAVFVGSHHQCEKSFLCALEDLQGFLVTLPDHLYTVHLYDLVSCLQSPVSCCSPVSVNFLDVDWDVPLSTSFTSNDCKPKRTFGSLKSSKISFTVIWQV